MTARLHNSAAQKAAEAALSALYVESSDGAALDPLTQAQIYQITRDDKAIGWRMPLPADYTGIKRELHFVVPGDFPAKPLLAYVYPPPFLAWPHCDSKGKLCIWIDDRAPVSGTPKSVVDSFVDKLAWLIHITGPTADPAKRQKEFADEWLSYWQPPLDSKKGMASNVMLVTAPPPVPCGLQVCFFTQKFNIPGKREPIVMLADNKEALHQWKDSLVEHTITDPGPLGLYEPLTSLPPLGAPVTLKQLGDLLANHATPGAMHRMKAHLARARFSNQWLILGLPQGNGHILVGICLIPTMRNATWSSGYQNEKTRNERDRQREKDPVWTVAACDVDRGDPAWMRDRDQDSSLTRMQAATVTIVGDGSLGSPIIDDLARYGLGNLIEVDGDLHKSENIGRHSLGAEYLRIKKVLAHGHRLRASFPNLKVTVIPKQIQDLSDEELNLVLKSDLVISAAASWPADNYLIKLKENGFIRGALLVCWAEPHAMAGQSLLSIDSKDNLSGQFEATGGFKKKATQWSEADFERRLPACQAAFQPAGYLGLRAIATMVAKQVTEYILGTITNSERRLWCENADAIQAKGGKVTGFHKEGGGLAGVFKVDF